MHGRVYVFLYIIALCLSFVYPSSIVIHRFDGAHEELLTALVPMHLSVVPAMLLVHPRLDAVL